MMKRLLLAVAFAAGTVSAAQPTGETSAPTEGIEPAAAAALDRMGAALQNLKEFNVHADITTEDVLTSGQKIQLSGSMDLITSRPNRMRAILKLGQAERLLFYDGASLTLYTPEKGYFASFAAPATIRETIDAAFSQHGIEIPLADLFSWSENPSLAGRVKSAFRVGVEPIKGQMCEHYAVRQELVDWQIWIRQGDDALPCKLVITSKLDPAMPQHSATYSWMPAVPSDSDAYTFKPAAGTTEIRFVNANETAAATGNK
jgi:hypothetical protein